MSDLMLLAVLEMPPELWDGSELDVMQRHARYKQAAERIRRDARTIERLRRFIREDWDHDARCLAWDMPGPMADNCTCGLKETLAALNAGKGEQ